MNHLRPETNYQSQLKQTHGINRILVLLGLNEVNEDKDGKTGLENGLWLNEKHGE